MTKIMRRVHCMYTIIYLFFILEDSFKCARQLQILRYVHIILYKLEL